MAPTRRSRSSKSAKSTQPTSLFPFLPRITDEGDWALPRRASSREANICIRRAPEQGSAFPFSGASEIPLGAYGQLGAQQGIAPLQLRDVLAMRGSVPRGGHDWVVEGQRLGTLHHDWDGKDEEPWPGVVPYQGRNEGSLTGWSETRERSPFVIPDPMYPPSATRKIGVLLSNLLDRVILMPDKEYQQIPPLIGDFTPANPAAPITLPSVFPRPRKFFRVQHSAATDRHGRETCPPSRTRDSTVLGLTAATIFPPCFERRINRANLERALDPMNVQPTSLVALYSNYGAALFDFEMHHGMECSDVYIAHIAAETFTCGTIPVMVTPPGLDEAQEVLLPTVGLQEPRVLLFSVLSCMEILGMQTEMTVSGVWFAIDSVPAQFIVRREARGVALDWSERDGRWARPGAGQPWEEWGEVGRARFGVDGVEVREDRPPTDEEIRPPHEGMPPPDYSHAPSISVNEEERNMSRSLSSFVDDETPDNAGRASVVPDETPDTTRSPEVPRVAQQNAGPGAGESSRASAGRASESREENENDEKESTPMTELQNLVNEEIDIITGGTGGVVNASKSPSLGHPSPRDGLFIYDSCRGMW